MVLNLRLSNVLNSLFWMSILSSSLSHQLLYFVPLSFILLVVPRPGRHRRPMTAPKTQRDKTSKRKKVILTVLTVVVLLGILVTAAYFSE